ncbi:MAG: hypothetical protein PHH37_05835 [Paludibacter sp.]|nr:hypothetical protein [Paludibacter sp.]
MTNNSINIQKIIPHTNTKGLLLIASGVWAFAGGMLLTRGFYGLFGISSNIYIESAISLISGLFFYRFMFSKISAKHVKRIKSITHTSIPFYAFFNTKSYIMMFSMIGLGITLRLTGLVPIEYLSDFYVTMGTPLLISSFRFLKNGIRLNIETKRTT